MENKKQKNFNLSAKELVAYIAGLDDMEDDELIKLLSAIKASLFIRSISIKEIDEKTSESKIKEMFYKLGKNAVHEYFGGLASIIEQSDKRDEK
ncbi:hypothetical protein DY120_07355 [Apilactobacillus micheneri]|uniref:Uncharacterized protein n=1 Tax=Apilactobacillus micheneri TaxID=1899430 RepID=A0ABY2YV43_9LACO|nr:hypothetical protein [Apilactobacillus micheneri]TPR23115.1 hypothetical protein DY114_07340 [Apilactobacillus micheneri]TPR24433.1 hypothetical protein DY111_07355 [Apilactobacillus micheneri]TPR29380.1 hypothetical protein DY120_07355 [Apilactobacillus micheneri]TPR34587.1 hypothetical protein DY027_07345 [Apilactobacillus micheneri]